MTYGTHIGGTVSYAGEFGYDARDQLATAAKTYTLGGLTNESYAYGYDGVGNRTAVNGSNFSFNSLNQRTAFDYDARGNLLSDGTAYYTWDALDRLTSVTSSNGLARSEFEYDGQNRRTEKRVYGGAVNTDPWSLTTTRRYAWEGDRLIAEFDGNNTLLTSYVWGIGGLAGGLLAVTDHTAVGGPATYTAIHDATGSLVGYLDGTGAVAATFRYDPYGVLLAKAGTAMNVGTYRYAGGQLDGETGLQYHLNRYYSPGQGRFLNRDPIAEAGGVNVYAYAGGDPVNFTDAAGHSRSGTPHRVVYPPAKPQAMRLGQTLIRPVGENEAGEIVWQLGHVVEGKYVMGGGRGGTRTEWRQEGALFRGNFLTAAEFTAEAYELTRSRAQAALDQDERAESIERVIGGLETARNFVPFATAVDMAHQGKWDEFNKAITVDLAILASGGVLKIAQLAKISRIGSYGARSMDELRLLAADQQRLLAVPLSEAALQARNASSVSAPQVARAEAAAGRAASERVYVPIVDKPELCFLPGTDVLQGNGDQIDIELIRVGDRLATDGGVSNNGSVAADPDATAVTRRWRLLTITAEQVLPDGSVDTWEVQTLQPRSWLRRHRADVGGVLALDSLLDLAEMGVPQGVVGTIVSVAAAPRVQRGPGRVVLTTVRHLNNFVFHLTLQNTAGQTDTLGVTGYHEGVRLAPYRPRTGGHHPMTGLAFEGVPGYSYNSELAISPAELANMGVAKHTTITGAQISWYKAFALSGKGLTLEDMKWIEINSLIDAGADAKKAYKVVDSVFLNLKSRGVSPVRTPWG